MSKIQSGLIFIFAGIIMNMLVRIFMPSDPLTISIFVMGFIGLWMIASLLVFLFGVYRCIVGFISKYGSGAAS